MKSAGSQMSLLKTSCEGGNLVEAWREVRMASSANGRAPSQQVSRSEKVRRHCFSVRCALSTAPLDWGVIRRCSMALYTQAEE